MVGGTMCLLLPYRNWVDDDKRMVEKDGEDYAGRGGVGQRV
jgi:hypothetical protein